MTDWTVLERPLRAPLAACLLIGIAMGGVLGWIAGRWSIPFTEVAWLNVLGVAGTLGAVLVALFFGAYQNWKSSTHDRKLAYVVQEVITPEISRVRLRLQHLWRAAITLQKEGLQERQVKLAISQLNYFLVDTSLDLTHRHFDRLPLLPRNSGRLLAKIIAKVPRIQQWARQTADLAGVKDRDAAVGYAGILQDEGSELMLLLIEFLDERPPTEMEIARYAPRPDEAGGGL